MNSEIAYLLGSYLGDGHIDYKNYAYQFSLVSEDLDFLTNNNLICQKHFNKVGRITRINNYYKLIICNKIICSFILDCCCSIKDYKIANKLQKKGKLPLFDDLSHKDSFLRGLMDSDGWISKKKNGKYIRYDIGFKNTSSLSLQIYNLMIDYGLQCNKFTYKPQQIKNRNGKMSVEKESWCWSLNTYNFSKILGFNIKRKQNLLAEYKNKHDI